MAFKKIARVEQDRLPAKWFKETAKLAAKRGTALLFAKDGSITGLLPKSGGNTCIRYVADKEWVDAVLKRFPGGAVFPDADIFGGPATTKALRAYGAMTFPEGQDGTAWIDPVTNVLHMKGVGAVLHSSAFREYNLPDMEAECEVEACDFTDSVSKSIVKLLGNCVSRDVTRPALLRVLAVTMQDGSTHLVATNGALMLAHRVEDLPEDFSFDPTLIGLHDICGYGTRKTPTGMIVRTYRMRDGMTISEKLDAGVALKGIGQIYQNAVDLPKRLFISAAQLRMLVEQIESLGICALDGGLGGVVEFGHGKTICVVNGQPVADFDILADADVLRSLGGEMMLRFALPKLATINELGGDMMVYGSDGVGYCENGNSTLIVMPVTLPKPEPMQG